MVEADYCLEAEENILCMLFRNGTELMPIAQDILKPNYFYREKNHWLYETCLAVYQSGQPVDVVTVLCYLKQTDPRKFEALDARNYLHYLYEFAYAPPFEDELRAYTKILLDCTTHREKQTPPTKKYSRIEL